MPNNVRKVLSAAGVVALLLSMSLRSLPAPVAHATGDTVYSDATQLDLSGDDNDSGLLDLPFTFHYYGQDYTQFDISTNGTITFGDTYADYENGDLSDGGSGKATIYAFWGDLDTNGLKNIFTKTVGEEGSRKLIIQWTNHMSHDTNDGVPFATVQAILTEGSNTVQLQYSNLLQSDYGKGSEATIGISDGTHYKQFSNMTASLSDRQALLFTPDGDTDYTMNTSATYDPVLLKIADQPEAPTLTSPGNSETSTSLTPTFTWDAPAGSGDDLDYQVYIASSPEFDGNSVEVDGAGTMGGRSFTPEPGTLRAGTQYWFVKAISNTNQSAGLSAIHSFTTVPSPVHGISNCSQLQAIDTTGANTDTYKLAADIDCTGVDFAPLGGSDAWNGEFRGIFNGQGHSISNLNVNIEGSYGGLFNSITDGAVIKNLTITQSSFTGLQYIGALAGYASNSTVQNVHVVADLEATNTGQGRIGGLFGQADSDYGYTMLIEDSSNSGSVVGATSVGGFIGTSGSEGNLIIRRSSSSATVDSNNDRVNIGGFIGDAYAGTDSNNLNSTLLIEDSYTTGDVTGAADIGGILGAAAPDNDGASNNSSSVTIRRSYASGQISGQTSTGGLIGFASTINDEGESINVLDSFAAATVNGSDSNYAAVVGYSTDQNVTYTNTFYEASLGAGNTECVYGTVSYDGCNPINAEDDAPDWFKNNTTYAPFSIEGNPVWDFETVWQTQETGYPVLRGLAEDGDNDGQSNFDETAGPNFGDANNDGTDDSEQANVTTFGDPVTGKYVVLQSSCTRNSAIQIGAEAGDEHADKGFDFPAGLLGFRTLCPHDGDIATITQYYYGSYDATKFVLRKWQNGVYVTMPGAVFSNVTIGGEPVLKVVYQITDGGEFDDDGQENGVIVDPVGPATNTVIAPNTGLGANWH